MDFDDNDTQSNNLELAGDSASKSSSLLRPYAFPRFDFDENLPGHLRFDSLVETEAYLGIQGQEDNHWIEDYSRGNSVIEFTSSATDSCSISRRHNVWSEATSSESVEMLLKSVGQEQLVPSESVIDSSVTCNDLDRLAKQMEAIRDKDNRSSGYSRAPDESLPSIELLSNLPVLKDSIEGEISQNQGASLSQVSLLSACEDPGHLAPNDSKDNFEAVAVQSDLPVENECRDSGEEAPCPEDESLRGPNGEDSSDPGVSSLDTDTSLVTLGSESQQEVLDPNHECSGDLRRGANDGTNLLLSHSVEADVDSLKQPAVEDSSHTADTSVCCGSKADKGNFEETIPSSCTDSAAVSSIEEPGFQLSKESGKAASCSSPSQPDAGGVNILCSGAMVTGAIEISEGTAVGTVGQHDTETCATEKDLSSSAELQRDSAMLLEHSVSHEKLGNLAENILEKDNKITDSIDEISPVREEADRPLIGKFGGSSSMDAGKLSDLPSISSEEPNREEAGASGNDISDASMLDREEPGSPSVSRDISVNKEDHINLSVNTSSTTATAGMIDPETESSIHVGSMTPDRKMVDQVSPHTSTKIDSDSETLFHEKDNNGLDANKKDVDPESSVVVMSELDSFSKISAEVSVSTLDRSDQGKTEADKATGVGYVHPAVSESQLSKSGGKFPSVVKEIECRATENSLCDDCPKELGSDLNQHDKSPNTTGSGDANHAKNHDGALKADKSGTELGADSLEVACGSPTIITLGNPSQDEECKHQETMGSGIANELSKPDQCISLGSKSKATIEDDNSFTFKVNSLPEAVEGRKGNNWTPLSKAESYNLQTVMEQKVVQVPTSADTENPDASTPRQTISVGPVAQLASATLLPETADQIPKASAAELIGEMPKGASGRRGRKASGKGTVKEGSSRLNSQKETTSIKSSSKGDKLPCASPSISGVTLPASNASASPPSFAFPQPFSDSQQVQLRSQIFVYGSLIQGSLPEEAYMVSAFGPTDGGRSMWDSVWRAAVERVRNQKSHSNLETPVHSTGVRSPEATSKQSLNQSRIPLSPSDRGGSKDSPTPILNPMIPLSSPLWGLPTPHGTSQSRGVQRGTILEFQPAISPLHPYQTPPIQGFIGNTAWPSQATFPPSPWASQKSALNTSACFTPLPLTEPVKFSSVIDSSIPPSSGIKNVSTNPMPLIGNPSLVFAGFPSSYPSQTMGVSSPLLQSADPKPRRRKKSQASNDGSQNPLIYQAQSEPVVASPAVISTLAVPASHVPPSSTVISPVCSVSPVSALYQPKVSGLDPRKSSYSEETLRKVSEAKLQAEEAASLAASALCHSESVWSGLSKQIELVTSSETEAKISSAAVAVAAAASVARAAAAAARVASNAAFQAKLMAEEALFPNGSENCSSEMQHMGERDGSVQPGSIIMAAKETAKRRIEVTTAAAKQAENVEAIVKAAELAEQAVSQAGRIVSMGDPLPLKDLITAGPEGYWKLRIPPAEKVIKSDEKNNEQVNVSALETEGGSSVVIVRESPEHRVRGSDMSSGSLEHVIADDIPQSIGSVKKDGHERPNISLTVESGGVGPVPENDSGTGTAQRDHEDLDLLGTSIRVGSVVEVYKHDGGLKPAWFSANVLALEDGKALASYSSLPLDEWVALEGEEDEAPRIRPAPESALDSQGTRKRRRTAMGDHSWSVGDRVDVQFKDCWWEGVVTEKNEKDETTLTVHFPARSETSAVRSLQLRPSRCWKDGKWVEWSRLRGQEHERDMPLEKRQKFGSPFDVSRRLEKLPKISETAVDRPDLKRIEKLPKVSETHIERPETTSLALSAGEKVFNVGKNTSKPDAGRTQRTGGGQKEGSKVVFGVPKPGKKRKFMEVSKHYSSGSSNVVAGDRNVKKKGNEQAKSTKYLTPHAAAAGGPPHPRAGKGFSRAPDSKGKQTAAVPRAAAASSHKLPPIITALRSTPREKSSSKYEVAAAKLDKNFTDPRNDDDDEEEEDNVSDKPGSMDHGSSGTEEVKEEGPLSSLFHNQLEKLSSAKGERVIKRKVGAGGPSSGKISRTGTGEDKIVFKAQKIDKASGAPEVAAEQPRRSGRRIQPTHRLLEGLQSSLIMPKASSVSHERSHKMPKTPKWK